MFHDVHRYIYTAVRKRISVEFYYLVDVIRSSHRSEPLCKLKLWITPGFRIAAWCTLGKAQIGAAEQSGCSGARMGFGATPSNVVLTHLVFKTPVLLTEGCQLRFLGIGLASRDGSYLVDPASSHMLVSKIKPCMSKYKQLIL